MPPRPSGRSMRYWKPIARSSASRSGSAIGSGTACTRAPQRRQNRASEGRVAAHSLHSMAVGSLAEILADSPLGSESDDGPDTQLELLDEFAIEDHETATELNRAAREPAD